MSGVLDGADITLHDGAVVIAAITSCTNTSQPVGDDRRRAAGEEGGGAGPHHPAWVKTSLAPGLAGRDRLPRGLRACCPTSSSSASTPWATAAPPASATAARCPTSISQPDRRALAGHGGGPERQPELRGPGPPPGAGQLPGLADAGGGLRPGRTGGHRPRAASRSAPDKDGRPVFLRDIWPSPAGGPGHDGAPRSSPSCSSGATRSVFEGDDDLAGACRCPEGSRYAWDPASTYVQEPPFFADLPAEPAPLRDIAGRPGAGRRWATRSPPTTSRPPARFPRTARPRATCGSTGWSRSTGTPSAPAGAITRS